MAALVAVCSAGQPAPAQPVDQPFTFSSATHSLPAVTHADLAMGDVDGDGDLDVFVSGILDGSPFSRLYRNDGMTYGDTEPSDVAYREVTGPFPDLAFGASAWGDFDGDGDLDLVVTGSRTLVWPYAPLTMLFRNDGGTFRAVDADLVDVYAGAAAWGDVDGDGDADLLLGGEDGGGESIAVLYRNDDGAFAAIQELTGLAYGDAAWGDMDGDGDLDLLLAGSGPTGFHADAYENVNGTLIPLATDLPGVAFASVDWGDVDGDGDLDVVLSGGRTATRVLEAVVGLFRNDAGSFTQMDVELPNVLSGDVSFADYDEDGDLDLFVMGAEGALGRRLARIYEQEVNGWIERARLIGVVFGTAAWGDVEGDGDVDLIAAGRPTANTPLLHVYLNARQTGTEPEPPTAPHGAPNTDEPHPFVAAPNPSSGSVTFHFTMPREGTVRLTLIDVLGRRVATVRDAYLAAGGHQITWNAVHAAGRPLGSGLYFAVLETRGTRQSTRQSLPLLLSR